MTVHAGWAPGLFAALRQAVDYGDEVRTSVYVYPDCPWPPSLAELGPLLLDRLEQLTGIRFTSVLIQGYLNETASVHWHSDPNFDAQAILATGATRRLGLRRADTHDEVFVSMVDGDLVVMPPGFQNEWEHSVPVEVEPCAERLALVFRTNHQGD